MWAFVCQTNLFKLQWLKQKNGATEKIEKTPASLECACYHEIPENKTLLEYSCSRIFCKTCGK